MRDKIQARKGLASITCVVLVGRGTDNVVLIALLSIDLGHTSPQLSLGFAAQVRANHIVRKLGFVSHPQHVTTFFVVARSAAATGCAY
jgi:hypothetical protein